MAKKSVVNSINRKAIVRDRYLTNEKIWNKIEEPKGKNKEPEVIDSRMYRDLVDSSNLDDYVIGGSSVFKPNETRNKDFFDIVDTAIEKEKVNNSSKDKRVSVESNGGSKVRYVILPLIVLGTLFLLYVTAQKFGVIETIFK